MIPLTPITVDAIQASALPFHTDAFYDRDGAAHLYELAGPLLAVVHGVKDQQHTVKELLQLAAYAALWAQYMDTQL